MKRAITAIVAVGMAAIPISAHADCVMNAKSKTSFQVLDSQTLLLRGGLGRDLLIKVPCCITGASRVIVLKDDFCSFESAALYIDGNVVDVMSVKNL